MKTIFITGASSGIGKATAKLFSAKGWQVIASMRNSEKGKELSRLANVVIMPLDISNPKQIKETCRMAIRQYNIDVLFNNAEYGIMAPMERIPETKIRKMFDTDVIGTMLVTQEFIPHFKERRIGAILTTTSLVGIIALPRVSVYGAAKRALEGMLGSLYYEMKSFGVAVKSIIPGATCTNFQTSLNDKAGYEKMHANQLKYLVNGHDSYPGPEEAADTVWLAVTDGQYKLHYPADRICKELYDQYEEMSMEKFKQYLYELLLVE